MTLEEMAAALGNLTPKAFETEVAKEVAIGLQAAVESTLSKGQTPEGQAWALRKAGGRAYVHASSKLSTKAYGNLVRMTLSGPEVFGHFGFKGAEPRRMIPDAGAGTPESVQKVLNESSQKVFERLTKGEK